MRNDGNGGIAQDMHPFHAPFGYAFGARRSYIILVDFVQHKSAEQAQAGGDADSQTDQDRQCGILEQIFSKTIAPSLYREQAELVGEHILADDNIDQDTDGHAHRACNHHCAVAQGAAPEGNRQRQSDGDQGFYNRQRHQYGKRWAEAGKQDGRNLFSRAPAFAEIKSDDLLDEYP